MLNSKTRLVTITFGILIFLNVVTNSALFAYEPDVISWEDAHKYYGKYVTVEGKIVATYNSGKACFLNFHTNWREHFTAVIFASSFNKFPPQPERYYDGKIVRVTGTIKEYKGKPQIIVKDRSEIKIFKNRRWKLSRKFLKRSPMKNSQELMKT